jgi:ABC-2 type transport system permease protein
MFNLTLFKKEIKSLWKMLLVFLAIIALYVYVIITMYDPVQMKLLDGYVEAMPEMMAAFGMTAGATTLLGFISSYLYGFMLLIVPMVFTIMCANRLIARYVERGAMVSLLAAPVTRPTVAFTQMKVLLAGIFTILAFTTILEIATAQAYFPNQLEIGKLLLLNFGLLGLQFFIGGVCFLSSCLFSDGKYSLGFGAGIPLLMYVFQAMANMGGDAANAKYLTVLTLFDHNGILAGKSSAMWGIAILWLGAVVLFGAAIRIFARKDLSI